MSFFSKTKWLEDHLAFWLTDVLLWGGLFFGVLALWGLYVVLFRLPQPQWLILPLTDADQLARGAQVRLMGVEVGTVEKVLLAHNRVEVLIKAYPGCPPLPKIGRVSIGSLGMAGGRTIELEPNLGVPLPPQTNFSLDIEDNTRFDRLLRYQADMAQKLTRTSLAFADVLQHEAPSIEQGLIVAKQSDQWPMQTARLNQRLKQVNAQLKAYQHHVHP